MNFRKGGKIVSDSNRCSTNEEISMVYESKTVDCSDLPNKKSSKIFYIVIISVILLSGFMASFLFFVAEMSQTKKTQIYVT